MPAWGESLTHLKVPACVSGHDSLPVGGHVMSVLADS